MDDDIGQFTSVAIFYLHPCDVTASVVYVIRAR